MKPGSIITYFDSDKITCGICLEVKENRCHLLSESNREVNLTLSRIALCSPRPLNLKLSREELLHTLKNTIRQEEELKTRVNTEELWNLLQGEEDYVDLSPLAEIVFGAGASSAHIAALFRALFEDKVHFKFKEGKFKLHSSQQVQQILMRLEREAERERELEEGSAWLKQVWGELPVEDTSRNEYYRMLLRELAIFGAESPHHQQGRELLKRANLTDPDALFALLVKLGEFQEDENILLPRYGIPTQWTEAALKETEAISRAFNAQRAELKKKRRDITSLEIFSIDSETTRDIDDALSIEVKETRYDVGVHITDVAHYITPDSHLNREAQERIASLYLPEGKIPMFPPLLSEDTLSLVEGKDRLALSLAIHFDSSFEIKEFNLLPSVINVHHRYSYTESDAKIASDKNLTLLFHLAQHLKKTRIKAGALFLPIPELIIKVDTQGAIQVSKRERETPSELIVSELMILTNWLCARFLRDRGIPLIYRNQLEPREMVEGAGKDNLYLNYRQRRLLNRATLSTTPDTHSNLGLKPYSTFTSPLRRYLDLIAQRQLKSALMEDKRPYSEEELKQRIVDAELTHTTINQVQEQRHRYWLLKYLQGKVGEVVPALVLTHSLTHCELLLTDYLLEVTIPSSPADSLSPGSTILVKLESANAKRGIIRVVPALR